ncbi:hypothetical protein D3C83_266470 [compost metagenome]
MSPIPPVNLATARRVASSLKMEWSIRSSVPARARIDSIISSVSFASGITACFSLMAVSIHQPARL